MDDGVGAAIAVRKNTKGKKSRANTFFECEGDLCRTKFHGTKFKIHGAPMYLDLSS